MDHPYTLRCAWCTRESTEADRLWGVYKEAGEGEDWVVICEGCLSTIPLKPNKRTLLARLRHLLASIVPTLSKRHELGQDWKGSYIINH